MKKRLFPIKKPVLFFLLPALILAGACSTNSNKKAAGMFSSIESHETLPLSAFTDEGNLYIKYLFKDKEVYFKADITDPGNEMFERYKIAMLEAAKPPKALRKMDLNHVTVINKGMENAAKNIFTALIPAEAGSGVIIMVLDKELFLYRDKDGKGALVNIKKMPAGIKVAGTVSNTQFSSLVIDEIKKEAQNLNITQTKFLIPLKNQPLEPYAYIDLENNISITLQLPEYYELKKQMSDLGFSLTFIYSFFIKSHFFAIIKAPFTSTHRLLSLTAASIYSALNPVLFDTPKIPPLNEKDEYMDIDSFNKFIQDEISERVYKGKLDLLIDGDEFFTHFIYNTINAAESIFIRLYIFGADAYSLKIADMLKEKDAQGLEIRLILDELNTILNNKKTPETAYSKDFVMPGSIKKYLKKKSGVSVRTHKNTWGTFDHNKIIIIDRKLAYTGGMNFAEEYRYTWHDMMLAMRGPIVGRMVKDFYKNWSFSGIGGDFSAAYRVMFSKKEREANKEEPGMYDIQVLYTAPGSAEIFKAQMEAIKRAKKRIYIQNAYFANDKIVKELIDARARGVDVRIILPAENDVSVMHKNNIAIANKLHRNGIKVYFFRGMTHVKAALYDNWALVGSANFDKMSLFVNKEMSLGISDEGFVKELDERLFQKDFENSDLMEEESELNFSYHLMNTLAKQF